MVYYVKFRSMNSPITCCLSSVALVLSLIDSITACDVDLLTRNPYWLSETSFSKNESILLLKELFQYFWELWSKLCLLLVLYSRITLAFSSGWKMYQFEKRRCIVVCWCFTFTVFSYVDNRLFLNCFQEHLVGITFYKFVHVVSICSWIWNVLC